jgi:murein L,D-transpeptidase YcbB/YkuD
MPAGKTDVDVGTIKLALRSFQTRNGLDADARAGVKTLEALNLSAAERANQIAANLERWRHLPRQLGERHIAVSIAGYTLDLIENGTSIFHTRVIVGKARSRSPMFRATVSAVTFNPPWNIPPSIASREILTKLKHDPGYLAAHDMVIVGRGDDPSGLTVDWNSMSARNFPFRLQQRPGLKNSLGVIKLEMPNKFNVYLHDTPAKSLFAQPQRSFSHGCVRVQHPGELARLVLNHDDWDADAIERSMKPGATRTVKLHHPVPVYLLYWTVFVDADGAVNFRDDLYGHDAPIEEALDLDLDRTPIASESQQAACKRPVGGLALDVD